MKSLAAMRSIALAAIFFCAACADTNTASEQPAIRASSYIYDPNAAPITLNAGQFIYDPSAPPLRASKFIMAGNP